MMKHSIATFNKIMLPRTLHEIRRVHYSRFSITGLLIHYCGLQVHQILAFTTFVCGGLPKGLHHGRPAVTNCEILSVCHFGGECSLLKINLHVLKVYRCHGVTLHPLLTTPVVTKYGTYSCNCYTRESVPRCEMCVKPTILLSTMDLLYGLITGGIEIFRFTWPALCVFLAIVGAIGRRSGHLSVGQL
jgi:hypothetical protein